MMRVLHVASEVAPFSQSGGLAQVAGALPGAIARTQPDTDVGVLTPFYRVVKNNAATSHGPELEDTGVRFESNLGGQHYSARVLTDPATQTFFVDCPPLYDRDGLYTDKNNHSWHDNPVRFALLSRLAVECGDALMGGPVDVFHAHDWQTGLVAAYARLASVTARTVFTIHNLAFQGVFDKSYVTSLGLDWSMFSIEGFEFYDQLSFLKSGAAFSDSITTVSPRYANEITTDQFGEGLAGFFRDNQDRLVGILNGIDSDAWNPATDPALPANFSADDLTGKRACREALRDRFGLKLADNQLLCGVVSRLAMQKGPDLIAEIVPELYGLGAGLVLVGSGDPALEHRFAQLAEWFSDNLAVFIGYDDGLARQVFAGCDALLMPSRFEPCGLAQLSAMRYGTLPIVHAVGGLADTVTDPGDAHYAEALERAELANTNGNGEAPTGFCFQDPDAGGLLWATERASTMFRDDQPLWSRTRRAAMTRDFSWDRAASQYSALYRGSGASEL